MELKEEETPRVAVQQKNRVVYTIVVAGCILGNAN